MRAGTRAKSRVNVCAVRMRNAKQRNDHKCVFSVARCAVHVKEIRSFAGNKISNMIGPNTNTLKLKFLLQNIQRQVGRN